MKSCLPNRSWLLDILILGVTFALFYYLWLGHHPLFLPDEGRYSEAAREMIATHDYVTPHVNGVVFLDKPILYYWLQTISMLTFGINEWSLRFFPALFGVMGCLMTYLCGRQLFDRRTAILSSIILAVSPLYFGSAHYANLDLEVAVLISCSLLCFITGATSIDKNRHYFIYAAYLFAALAFLTKGLIGIVFISMIAGAWITLLNRWHVLKKIHLFSGVGLFSLIVFPWYYLAQQANPNFLHFFFVTQHFSRFLSTNTFNNTSPHWFYLPIVLAGFFPWSAFIVQAINQSIRQAWSNKQEHAAELFLLLWIGIVFVFFSIPHSKIITYILPIFPALALLVGHYLSCSFETTKNKLGVVLYSLLCLLLAGLLFSTTYFGFSELILAISHYTYFISALLVISAITSCLLFTRKNLLPLFSLCALTSALILLIVLNQANNLNQTTTKPLIAQLLKVKAPNDEIVNYFKFYQDVPLFLGHPVTLVADWEAKNIAERDNWVRELAFGYNGQQKNDHLISENVFWDRFHSNERVFVFLNNNYFEQFKARARHYYIIGKHNDVVLLSNKMS